MSAVINKGVAPQVYLDWEAEQVDKHEYVDGEVFAMVGATRRHNRIAGNLYRQLADKLEGRPCEAFISDMKLQIDAANAYYYPDVMVTCDDEDLRAEQIMRSPTLIIEVLSPSTAAHDRGDKFAAYRKIAALRKYLLIDAEGPRIDGFRRNAAGQWLVAEFSPQESVKLQSLGIDIEWSEIFRGAD